MITAIRRATLAACAIALFVGLVACSGDSDSGARPKPSASTSASGGSDSRGQSAAAQELVRQYLNATAKQAVLASVKGTVRDGSGKDVPGVLDLISVTAGTNSTAVRWKLSTEASISAVSTNYYNRRGRAVPDTTQVVLIAKSADMRLESSIWTGSQPSDQECTCAWSPEALGPNGLELSSLYPALPAAVTEVELRVPGFPAVSAAVRRS